MEAHHHVYDNSCAFCCSESNEIFPYYIDNSGRKEDDQQNHPIEEPYRYNYLLNLMIAPDLNAYLSISSDEVYELPLHLQKLIIEAKEEILLEQSNAQLETTTTTANNNRDFDRQAQVRLEKLKHHFLKNSDGDLFHLMKSLHELIADEGELEDLLRIYQ